VALLTAGTFALELIGTFGMGLAAALVAAYLLAVVRAAAHGAPRLPDAADFTGLESWLVPLGQVALAFAPSIALVAWDYALESPRFVLAALDFDPAFRWTPRRWSLAAVGLAFAPPGLLSAALTEHPLAPLHVPLNARFALRAPVVCLRVAVLLFLGWTIATLAALAVDAVPVGESSPVVMALRAGIRWLALASFAALAFAVGWTIYRQADTFGLPRRPEHVRRHEAFEARPAPGTPGADVETKPRLLRDR
jgi:hypothetical protein